MTRNVDISKQEILKNLKNTNIIIVEIPEKRFLIANLPLVVTQKWFLRQESFNTMAKCWLHCSIAIK